MYAQLEKIDSWIIETAKRVYMPMARIAFFIIFFYFGLLKLVGLSPASTLAEALTTRTIGMEYFDALFMGLAVVECLIGLLFLVPKATRLVIGLLLLHMVVVCSPLLLVPDMAWTSWLVPTLEGQYIIKNIALIAIAISIAAHTVPLQERAKTRH